MKTKTLIIVTASALVIAGAIGVAHSGQCPLGGKICIGAKK